MSWDFRIVSAIEARPLSEDFGGYIPRAPLRSFKDIYDWITQRAPDWAKHDDPDRLRMRIGPNAGCTLHLITVRWYELARDGRLRGEDLLKRYVPGDDEMVTEIFVVCRGSGPCDYSLLAECATWLGAVVLDCSGDEFEAPEEWLTRERAKPPRPL